MLLPFGLYNAADVRAYSSTGAGLAEHALTAYYEHWNYSYGCSSQGAVDCSGLIASYNGVGGSRSDMLSAASESGGIGSLPNIHGLGLHQPGHVGVYVGGGMAVDARNESYGIVYESVYSHAWTSWFKVAGVQYPDTGWESFNGEAFYYVDGQYVTNTTLTVDGTNYKFGADGALIGNPPANMAASYSSSAKVTVSNQTAAAESSAQEVPAAPKPVVLDVGCQSEEVLKMKTRLQALGYYESEVTDYFGDFTSECVKKFQKQVNLDETGVADQKTLDALYADNAPSAPIVYGVGSTGEEVASLKNRLAALSYYYGEATDSFGDDTALAVSDFQQVTGLEMTGQADDATRAMLYDENAPVNPESGTLKYGIVSEKVTALQNRLIALRYMVGPAGETFDGTTEAAVKNYQSAAGLEQTGKLDKQALEILFAEDAVRSPEYGALRLGYVGEDVKLLQRKLSKLQYFSEEVDGVFGESTDTALRAFQTEQGLKLTGIATAQSLYSMDSALQEMNKMAAAEVINVSLQTESVPLSKKTNDSMGNTGERLTQQQSASNGNTTWFVVMGALLMIGMLVAYLLQKRLYLFSLKKITRKYKISKNTKAMELMQDAKYFPIDLFKEKSL